MTQTVVDLVAASHAAHLLNDGFIKKNDPRSRLDAKFAKKASNAELIYKHFDKNKPFTLEVTEHDYEMAKEIMDFIRGLGMLAIKRPLTEFEEIALLFVREKEGVPVEKWGTCASFPQMYYKNIAEQKWYERESELALTSEFIAERGHYTDFNLKVEHVVSIPGTFSYYIICTDEDENVVKFYFDKYLKGNINVRGQVKDHDISDVSNVKMTLLRSVVVRDSDP